VKELFQIDIRHQLKSSKQIFIGFVWIMVSMIIGHFFIADSKLSEMLTIGLIFWLFTSVGMILPFHIQYLITNWNMKLVIDHELGILEIVKSGITHSYKFSDLKLTRCILGHYKPGRTKSWTPIPFDYYGYIEVKTNDDKRLYLTSLMIDPFNFPISISNTKYGFPFITGK
jgi:hypothetical protein